MKSIYLSSISIVALSIAACQPPQSENDVLSKIKSEDLVRGETGAPSQTPTTSTSGEPSAPQPSQPLSLAELQARAAQQEINNAAVFEENKGQFGPGAESILYRAAGRDFQFYILTNGWSNVRSQFTPDPNQPQDPPEPGKPPRPPKGKITTHRVDYIWINPNNNALVEAKNPSQETRNFLGTHAGDITGVRIFGNVTFSNLYNNIDLDFSAPKNTRHHIYTVKPGGEISDLRFTIKYSNDVTLENDKKLLIHTTLGELPYTLLIEQDGKEVEGKFVLTPKGPPRPKAKKKEETPQPGPDVEVAVQVTGTVDKTKPYTVTLIER